MRRALLAAWVLAACKEPGPPLPDPKVVRDRLCAEAAPAVKALSAQLRVVAGYQVPDVKVDAAPGRAVRLRALHGEASTEVLFGEAPGAVAQCAAMVERCEAELETVERVLGRCAGLDSVVLVRPNVDEPVKVNEAMLNKYLGGRVNGVALAYALMLDGGTPQLLGAVRFDVKLRGGVEVDRDAPTEEREKALNDALHRQVLEEVEAKLAPPRPSAP
ncbi:MAG: hypothetical protein IPJ65_11040 [Archangiaceae bacterium]|nr:hypothetical protein [Archangiaceae bacterium]